ncbi:MAG: formylglycine-generating enzyme family protein, partial [Cyanobacteria bacterium J06559_3]
TETAYNFGPKITTELANYSGEVGQTMVVGNYPPNRWGLHDMHGNVWEWCADYWHVSYESAPQDGSAWLSSGEDEYRTLRGGSWNYDPRHCRSTSRYYGQLSNRNLTFGFRVCCSPP